MAENIFKVVDADPAVTQQFLDATRRSERLEPELALLRAILEDAIYDYRKYANSHDLSGRRRFREVESWLMGENEDWIFSFQSVCEHLGLDPNYVRRGLLEQKSGAKPHHPKPREHAA